MQDVQFNAQAKHFFAVVSSAVVEDRKYPVGHTVQFIKVES